MLEFLSKPLLWGLVLASVPLIIHLLFRRRFRRIDWAPMYYLKLSIQRNRRRIRLEQLLLLLLRTAMVALLFFIVARPVLHGQGLGAWLSGGSRVSQILVIDDSLSMGLHERGRTALERAGDLAGVVFKNVGAKDHFTLVLASKAKEPLLREVEGAKVDQVGELLKDLKPSDVFITWEPTLAAIDDLVTGSAYPIREVTIITDLRKAGWDKDLSKLSDRWAAENTRVRVFDVGARAAAGNVSIDALEQFDRLALVGAQTHWTATLRNGGAAEVAPRDADFVVDGKPTLVRVPAMAPGETIHLPLAATFQEVGPHHVELRLPSDDLEADNHRWATVNVRESVQVVLVDGEPSSEPLLGEVDFLTAALTVRSDESDSFHVEIAADADWSAALEAKPDLLVLANVADITPPQVERLTRLVEGGMGLVIFLGDQVDPDKYNQLLYAEGKGLLPAALESIGDEEVAGLVVDPSEPTPLKALLTLHPAVLERIGTHKFFETRAIEESSDRRVLARWNNVAGSPAALEKVVGKGRVLLWTITADKQWSDWPSEYSYVFAMRESAAAIARDSGGDRTVTAGARAARDVVASHQIESPAYDAPGADSSRPLRIEGESRELDATRELVIPETLRAGLYKMTWMETPSGPQSDMFAVNPDERESELSRLGEDELKHLWGQAPPEVISASGDADATLAVRGQEVWRPFAFCLLGMAAFEAFFATWTGRQR